MADADAAGRDLRARLERPHHRRPASRPRGCGPGGADTPGETVAETGDGGDLALTGQSGPGDPGDGLDLAPTSDVQADAPGESRETGNGPDLAPTSDGQADAPGETDAPRDAPGDLAPTSDGP